MVAKRCLLPRCGSVRVKDRWRTELFFSNRRTENNGQKIKRVGRRLMRGGLKDVEAIKVIPENSLQPGRIIRKGYKNFI